ncbi:MAG TPA: family 6 glucosyltransferase [Ferruginibacter sp.]|nr:family 6 glucosyltransferase [Ferruginibacter sp.]HMP19347.1 family 6 glucosyltransferase [Ferruginibacter sp.]
MRAPTVAILYICTGRYTVFWKNFYDSAAQLLLPGMEKHYYVFTDAKSIYMGHLPNVHLIYQEAQPWPWPTLLRFRFFKSIETQLQQHDYIYFFNANTRIYKTITANDILPAPDEELVVTQHPGFWDKTPELFTYERNPVSEAYIPAGEGEVYVAGGLNGGRAASFINFVTKCSAQVDKDLQQNIIATWHDESHLNKYILHRKVKLLHPGFLYPHEMDLPFEKMIHLEYKKDFIGGYGKYSLWHKLKKAWPFK